jgi:hypothetical protein
MSSTRAARTAFAAAHNEFDLHLQNTVGGEHAAKGWIESSTHGSATATLAAFSTTPRAGVTTGSSRTLRVDW